jgi:hypothetical protein
VLDNACVCVLEFLPSIAQLQSGKVSVGQQLEIESLYRLFFLHLISSYILPHGIFVQCRIRVGSNIALAKYFPIEKSIDYWIKWNKKMMENSGSSFCDVAIHYKTLDPISIQTQFGTEIRSPSREILSGNDSSRGQQPLEIFKPLANCWPLLLCSLR